MTSTPPAARETRNSEGDPLATRRRRLSYRAWHRGTKEADLLIGGFCDRHMNDWDAEQIAFYEALLEETDVDIMAWAIGTQPVPVRYRGEVLAAMRQLDYLRVS